MSMNLQRITRYSKMHLTKMVSSVTSKFQNLLRPNIKIILSFANGLRHTLRRIIMASHMRPLRGEREKISSIFQGVARLALPPRRVLLSLQHRQDLQQELHQHHLDQEADQVQRVKKLSVVELELLLQMHKSRHLKLNYKNLSCKMTLSTKSAIFTSVNLETLRCFYKQDQWKMEQARRQVMMS